MSARTPFHLVYAPAEADMSRPERVVALFQTDDPEEVTLQLQAVPGSIAMLLEAFDLEEAKQEVSDLGF